MSFGRENHPDELISASLSGDLTGEERARLDAHLAGCEHCRQTLAAFSEQRNLLGGMRRAAPPRDLGARVRAGVEASRLSWWQRPGTWVAAVASLATVAAALLAVVVLGNLRLGPTASTGSPGETASLLPSATAFASVVPSPSATIPEATESPLATPSPSIDPRPIARFEYTLSDGQPSLQLVDASGKTVMTVDVPPGSPVGVPIETSASSAGQWIALRLELGSKGTEALYVINALSGDVFPLGETLPSPFAHRFAWSQDEAFLAFTLIDTDGKANAWLFDAESTTVRQLTDIGQVFVADFEPNYMSDSKLGLWVSIADATPRTYRIDIPLSDAPLKELSPSAPGVSGGASDGVFLPTISPDHGSVIYWQGQMQAGADGLWTFARGGMLYLATGGYAGNLSFDGEQLFPTLQPATSGQAFASAEVRWAPDGDGYAVWRAAWTGTPEPQGFPSAERVYFGHVSNGEGITQRQALDEGDLPGDGSVLDVVPAPDGVHLAITVRYPVAGALAQPRADLLLVTRNVGDVPDQVQTLGGTDRWTGPAVYGSLLTP